MGKKAKSLYSQQAPLNYEERIIAYMRLKKSELAKMLATRDMIDDKNRRQGTVSISNFNDFASTTTIPEE